MREALAAQRMHSLGLLGQPHHEPSGVIRWLGAVQAQDERLARWSVAMRTQGATDAELVAALDAGTILRTHVLRPTWHFVLPEDLRWLLRATAGRIRRRLGAADRREGIDAALQLRCNGLLEAALADGHHRTRRELGEILDAAGIAGATGSRLGHLLMNAELEGLICSGRRSGKQHTYALLDERVPAADDVDDDRALAELTRRYFTSHGPATVKDFQWWATLTVAQVRRGLGLAGDQLVADTVDGAPAWRRRDWPPRVSAAWPMVHLLQPYDEYIMGYTQSRRVMDSAGRAAARAAEWAMGTVVLDTQFAGVWRVAINRGGAQIQARLVGAWDEPSEQALHAAAQRYAGFAGVAVDVARI